MQSSSSAARKGQAAFRVANMSLATKPFDSEHSLRSKVNNGIRQAIFEDSESEPTTNLLYDLIFGYTSPSLATTDIMAVLSQSKDDEPYLSSLSTQTIFLACEYPFLQPQLINLVTCILQLPPNENPSEIRSGFVSAMATAISDTTRSNYGNLFEDYLRTPGLISDHTHLNRFIARLLSADNGLNHLQESITGLDDALFILSTSLEGHADSHNLPEIDIPAAAQYVIHAGEFLFEACQKRIGQDLANTSPSWATRGKLWKGESGLSRERWDFWKSIFLAAKSENVTEETKKTALTAVRAMSLVENSKES